MPADDTAPAHKPGIYRPESQAAYYAALKADPDGRQRLKARKAARRAVRQGTLFRQPCEVCGAERVEAHHDDYSKPREVRWLCRAHHAEHHRRERENARLAA